MRWLRILALLILVISLIAVEGLLPQNALAVEASLPTTTYDGATVPDFAQVTFSNLPAIQRAGTLQVSEEAVNLLGYDPSRTWQAGAVLGEVFMLGDAQDAFGLQTLSLSQIAQLGGLDLSQLSLNNFRLLEQQTIATLIQAIPLLGNFKLGEVKPLADLVNQSLANLALDSLNLKDWGNNLFAAPLSIVADSDILGSLSLNNLSLDQYSFTQIPGLDQVPLSNFQHWQTTVINGVPGLAQVAFAQFPINPFQILGLVATHDVTYGGNQFHKESHQTPIKFSITGRDRVGFRYNCNQPRGCDYLELNTPGYSGRGGLDDPMGLHGARWIRGGAGDGEQMVPGGYGVLGQLNGGMEPTGRLSFGPAFKVVLTETDESTGTGQFGLYFRVCIRHLFVDLGCTPYFIGPIPFLSTKEKGLVFVGLGDGSGGMQELPPGVQLPPDIQEQIDQITNQYGGNTGDSSDFSGLCGSVAGVDLRALADAISSIEGGYSSAGQYGCDLDGNCGRGLGRYQFMTYRKDARAIILKQPGGAAFLQRANVSSNSSEYLRSLERELPKYFPPSAQDSVFKQAMTQNINYYQKQGKKGSELIACLGESWYSGECSQSGQRDYTGGPTVREYGQRIANTYEQALKRYASKPCAGNGQPGVTTGSMIYPVGVAAPITGQYGEDRGDHAHAGVDFAMPIGTPVKAADGGVVVDACIDCDPNGYGSLIIVRHSNGLETWYAHVDTIKVKVGDKVAKGQVIGTVGNRGRSSGPHLHFEVRKGGIPVSPLPYLKKN